jgi:DNA-binding NtrC family response regulator
MDRSLRSLLHSPLNATIVGRTNVTLPEDQDRQIDLAASSDRRVLIWHEDALKRKALAVAIHERSSRKAKPFVCAPCDSADAPNAEDRFHAAFMGHERRALAATPEPRPGLFESADDGTVFIDDIAQLSATSQWLVFSALETGSTYRLGGTVPNRADVRFLCGTSSDLRVLVKAGVFREDLFRKLSLFADGEWRPLA